MSLRERHQLILPAGKNYNILISQIPPVKIFFFSIFVVFFSSSFPHEVDSLISSYQLFFAIRQMLFLFTSNKALNNIFVNCFWILLLILISLRSYFPLPFSIIDGRYNEQKHRLQECGLRNCVYIVEGLSLSGEWSRVE